MAGFILILILWASSVVLMTLFFDMALGRRVSVKKVVIGGVSYYGITCLQRIPVLTNIGVEYLGLLNLVGLAGLFAYQLICFKGRWYQRLMAVAVIMLFMQLVEMTGSNLTFRLTGSYEMYQLNSIPFAVNCLICILLQGLVIQPAVLVWNAFQRMKRKDFGKTWLCVLFPISQYLIMESYLDVWAGQRDLVPILVIAGMLLGTAANLYVFVLLTRENARIQAEQELRKNFYMKSKESGMSS